MAWAVWVLMVSCWKKTVIWGETWGKGGEEGGEEGERGEEGGETASHHTVPSPHSHSRPPLMVIRAVVMEVLVVLVVLVAVGRVVMVMGGR